MEELKQFGITDKKTYRQWCVYNHPDKGGDEEIFVYISVLYKKYIDESHKINTDSNDTSEFEDIFNLFSNIRFEKRQYGINLNIDDYFECTNCKLMFLKTKISLSPNIYKLCYNCVKSLVYRQKFDIGNIFTKYKKIKFNES